MSDFVVLVFKDETTAFETRAALAKMQKQGDYGRRSLQIDRSTLDWVKLAEGQGVPATRAATAEEFHQQFATAMSSKGPRLIEAQIVQNLKPVIDAVHNARG